MDLEEQMRAELALAAAISAGLIPRWPHPNQADPRVAAFADPDSPPDFSLPEMNPPSPPLSIPPQAASKALSPEKAAPLNRCKPGNKRTQAVRKAEGLKTNRGNPDGQRVRDAGGRRLGEMWRELLERNVEAQLSDAELETEMSRAFPLRSHDAKAKRRAYNAGRLLGQTQPPRKKLQRYVLIGDKRIPATSRGRIGDEAVKGATEKQPEKPQRKVRRRSGNGDGERAPAAGNNPAGASVPPEHSGRLPQSNEGDRGGPVSAE